EPPSVALARDPFDLPLEALAAVCELDRRIGAGCFQVLLRTFEGELGQTEPRGQVGDGLAVRIGARAAERLLGRLELAAQRLAGSPALARLVLDDFVLFRGHGVQIPFGEWRRSRGAYQLKLLPGSRASRGRKARRALREASRPSR